MAERIGDFMLRTNAMTQDQVDAVIHAKRTGDKRPFGQIAVELGFVDFSKVQAFISTQA